MTFGNQTYQHTIAYKKGYKKKARWESRIMPCSLASKNEIKKQIKTR